MKSLFRQIHCKRDPATKWKLCVPFVNTGESQHGFKKLVCIVSITNCIMMATLILTTYYWKLQSRSWTSAGDAKEKRFCLKCEDISLHPIEDVIILTEFESKDNGTKCCTKETSQLKHLVHQFLERNQRMYMAKEGITIPQCPDYTNEGKPGGRVVGVDHTRRGTGYEERHILRWQNGDDSYQTPGVIFNNGQLVITTPGYYWFNCRVTFRDTNSTIWNDSYAFFHTIFRRSSEYPLREDWKLVEAGKTRCKLRFGFSDRSSFLGDMAYFKNGESIIVKVSHPELVSLSTVDTFLDIRLY